VPVVSGWQWACAPAPAGEAVTMTTVTRADTQVRGKHPVTIRTRSPVRAALLSLVTFSLYGFWWWWDVNHQLKALGQPAHPWRALAAITAGWVAVIPPFLSVRHTATMIAEAERRAGAGPGVSAPVAVAIAATAAAGAVAWAALSLAAVTAGIYIGLIWAVLAMMFVGYLQRGLNRAVGEHPGR
jgi:hypothetical protein